MNHNQRVLETNEEFKYGLCDCSINTGRCCYIFCCFNCAVADLSLAINPCCIESKQLRWWLLVLANLIIACIGGANGQFGGGCVGSIMVGIGMYVVYTASMNIAERIGYRKEEFGCGCCFTYFFCTGLKACQVANQLDVDRQGTQCRGTVELITEINNDTPLKNCLCQVTNPAPDVYEQENPAPVVFGQQQNPVQSHVNVANVSQSAYNPYVVPQVNPYAIPQENVVVGV
jgi:hypothetical protein